MARPRKWRKVCALPTTSRFGPTAGADDMVVMSIDEYESIRLIDMERMTQEECARQMNVARTTVQGIYDSARRKIADSLINGKMLYIKGGDYQLCDGKGSCGGRGCKSHMKH